MLYAYAGDKSSAINLLERSFRLDPLGRSMGFYFGYVLTHFVAGDHEAAAEWSSKALRERPNNAPMLRYRAASLGLLGRLEQGREDVRRLLEYVPNFSITRARRHVEFDMNNVFKTPGVAESLYEGLRKSGVPE
jgi:tetratricopeptide (TPR) repeat protein